MSEISDSPSLAEQVIALQNGSDNAFNVLYAEFHPLVFGIAIKICCNVADAEDITQTVFQTVFRRIHQLQDPKAFGGWIARTAVRLSINYTKRRPSKEFATEHIGRMHSAKMLPPDVQSIRSEYAMHIKHLLATHQYSIDRDAIHAFYFEGLSLAEMAQKFELPLGTIKRRLNMARNRFRVLLEEKGIHKAEL